MLFKANKVKFPLAAEFMECDFGKTIGECKVPVCSIQGENGYQQPLHWQWNFLKK